MASWSQTARVAVPATRPATRARPRQARPAQAQRRVAGHALWIVAAAALLAGVVALNVAVLRLNLRLDHLGQESTRLRAENAALASKLSSADASPRIEAMARRMGFVPAESANTTYLDLTPRR
jgi:hypothetical protein